MDTQVTFYICPYCFELSEAPKRCHQHDMRRFEGMSTDDERLKPLMTADGSLKTRAPRWYLAWIGESAYTS